MKKYIVFIFIVLFTVTPVIAQAQWVVTNPTHEVISIGHAAASHVENVAHIGVSGTTAASTAINTGNSIFQAIQNGTMFEHLGVDQAFSVSLCSKLEGDNFFTTLLDSFGNALASTGDQTQTAGTFFISKKLNQLRVAKTCYEQLYDASERVLTPTDRASSAIAAKRQNFLTAQASVKTRMTNLQAQEDASLKDVFKAFSMSVILELNKNLTTKVINDLKDKYKIGGYLNYVDALASQVYAVDYIKKNYAGDNQQQLIMSSLLKAQNIPGPLANNLYYKTAQSAIEASVAKTCPSSSTLAAWNTQNWYQTVNSAASEGCDARLQRQKADEQLQILLGNAKQAAIQEVQSSTGGFKSTRNCTDATAQNQQIDTQYKTLDTQIDKARAVMTQAQAQSAQLISQNSLLTPDAALTEQTAKANKAYDDAKAAFDSAQKAYVDLPDQVNGGVVKLCEAISSPATFLATSINQYLGQQLQQTFDLKSDNLPLYGKILSKYTSNFITNMLLGKDPGQVLKEDANGFLGAGLGAATSAAIETIGNGGTSGTGNTRVVTPSDNKTSCMVGVEQGHSFKLTWNETGYNGAKSVTIDPVVGSVIQPVSGSVDVCVTILTNFKFKVYDKAVPTASDTPIGSDTVQVDPSRYLGFNSGANGTPRVAGAQTVQPRGPQPVIR